mmetsp:Transcript_18182/g.26626  ORF Transcript_18182/g.26626 Transcript_18182/m.26626 type:complete len:310 (+) Transcript_18182:398-1327(+)
MLRGWRPPPIRRTTPSTVPEGPSSHSRADKQMRRTRSAGKVRPQLISPSLACVDMAKARERCESISLHRPMRVNVCCSWATGRVAGCDEKLLLPNCPRLPFPHVQRWPSSVTAAVCAGPHATVTTLCCSRRLIRVGTKQASLCECPSCQLFPTPHVNTRPFCVTAAVWSSPHATVHILQSPNRAVGISVGTILSAQSAPWPRRPWMPQPHVQRVLLLLSRPPEIFATAAVCENPQATMITCACLKDSGSIRSGTKLFFVIPSPSCPLSPVPKVHSFPELVTAAVCPSPQATICTFAFSNLFATMSVGCR